MRCIGAGAISVVYYSYHSARPVSQLLWPSRRTSKRANDKLQTALAAYVERFRMRPTLVLINAAGQVKRSD